MICIIFCHTICIIMSGCDKNKCCRKAFPPYVSPGENQPRGRGWFYLRWEEHELTSTNA